MASFSSLSVGGVLTREECRLHPPHLVSIAVITLIFQYTYSEEQNYKVHIYQGTYLHV